MTQKTQEPPSAEMRQLRLPARMTQMTQHPLGLRHLRHLRRSPIMVLPHSWKRRRNMKYQDRLARMFVSIAAAEAKIQDFKELEVSFRIEVPGQPISAFFTGWYFDAGVIDIVAGNDCVAVGWLSRHAGQVKMWDCYSQSPEIVGLTPYGSTPLLRNTSRPTPQVFEHLSALRVAGYEKRA